MLIADNLPGDIVAAHIHGAPKGVAGPVDQPLPPTPGPENAVIGAGTFSNPALVGCHSGESGRLLRERPHKRVSAGAIRGQLGDRGPSNN